MYFYRFAIGMPSKEKQNEFISELYENVNCWFAQNDPERIVFNASKNRFTQVKQRRTVHFN